MKGELSGVKCGGARSSAGGSWWERLADTVAEILSFLLQVVLDLLL